MPHDHAHTCDPDPIGDLERVIVVLPIREAVASRPNFPCAGRGRARFWMNGGVGGILHDLDLGGKGEGDTSRALLIGFQHTRSSQSVSMIIRNGEQERLDQPVAFWSKATEDAADGETEAERQRTMFARARKAVAYWQATRG